MKRVLRVDPQNKYSIKQDDKFIDFDNAADAAKFLQEHMIKRILTIDIWRDGNETSDSMATLILEVSKRLHFIRPDYLGAPYTQETKRLDSQGLTDFYFVNKNYILNTGWFITITKRGDVASFQTEPKYLENLDTWYMQKSGGSYKLHGYLGPQEKEHKRKIPGTKQAVMTDIDIFLLRIRDLVPGSNETVLYKGTRHACEDMIRYHPLLWETRLTITRHMGSYAFYVRKLLPCANLSNI